MSVLRAVRLLCDGGAGCPLRLQAFACRNELASATEQREEAAGRGWAHRDGRDFCPACAERLHVGRAPRCERPHP